MIVRPSTILVTGLSGAGRSSILRTLEDLGYDTVDNLPMSMLSKLIELKAGREVAIGVDIRSDGFDISKLLQFVSTPITTGYQQPDLIFATAEPDVLLRRYKETRRRHPLAIDNSVECGIARETMVTLPLREAAALVLDTSELNLADLQRAIQFRYGTRQATIALISFAFPHGLPRDSDIIIDVRFLRNPHYDPELRLKTGRDNDVGLYIQNDPDFSNFFARLISLLDVMLPRFVQEGKKYATISLGCTGGRHRSVYVIERLSEVLKAKLAIDEWRIMVTHRELEHADAAQC